MLGAIDRVTLGIGPRGTTIGPLGRERSRKDWLRRVHAANLAAADARNAFVKANLRLVVSIARRFNHGRMALADLIQEGNLGLMKAVERYDYRRGFRFSTYASWWIRHAISRALADKGREVRLPVHMIDAQHRLTKARRQLTGQLGRQPTSEELAAATDMPVDKIEKMRSWLLEQSISIDKPVGDDEGRVLGEVLEDPDREEVSPTGDLEWEALTAEVRDLLRELRPIEADILRQRFGLGTEQELTLKEIGDKYNLSRERIRQLQEQALAKMRRALARRDLL
ncbi:MAG TPA: sigma-70 family RNA polymerase sigma factor [Kofleriaceae bacterium]